MNRSALVFFSLSIVAALFVQSTINWILFANQYEGFASTYNLEGPTFLLTDETKTIETITVPQWDEPGEVYSLDYYSGGNHCLSSANPEGCSSLLMAAISDRLAAGGPGIGVAPARINECTNCSANLVYLFLVDDESAVPISRQTAISLFGRIDTPNEAMVIVGEAGMFRESGNGYEILIRDRICFDDGPRLTIWRVDADGSSKELSSKLEHKGDTCDDV